MKFRHSLLSVSVVSALTLLSQQVAQAADTTDVKVGFAAPLTGVNAGYGKDLQNGVQLALDDAVAQKVAIAGKPAKFNLVVQDDPSRVVCSELVYRGYAEAVTRPANALRLPITHRASQSTPLPKIDFIALAMECLEDYQRANPKGALRAATPAELPDLLAQARSTLGIGGLQASGTGDIAPNPKTVLPADLEFSGGLRKLGRLPLAA